MAEQSGIICMAVYRPNAALLRQQIDSIKNQSYSSWTCIIGIDGQDPDAVKQLTACIDKDPRFEVYEFDQRVGFYRNFERILAEASSFANVSWVALADQDDRWYPEKLSTLVPRLTDKSLVSGQARLAKLDDCGAILGIDKTTLRKTSGLGDLIFDNAVSGALSVFRPEVLRVALPFPQETDASYHDHWLGLCALLMDGIEFEETPVQDYVQHGSNVIGERRPNVFQRFRTLGKRAGKQGAANYLVNQRWRWRVNMCTAALQRVNKASPQDRRVLQAFAANQANHRLVWEGLRAIRSGNGSRLRTAALLFASLLAPAFERKINERTGI